MGELIRAICPICGHLAFFHKLKQKHNFPDVRVFNMLGRGQVEIYDPDPDEFFEVLDIIRKKCIWTLRKLQEIYDEMGIPMPDPEDENLEELENEFEERE